MRILNATVLLLIGQSALAYEPPIGIPDPGQNWGDLHPIDTPTPDLPENWVSEQPGFYYIDPSHPNATDDNNIYGYPTKPRKRLGGYNKNFPIVYPAGSVVVLGGTFAEPFNSKDFYRTVTFECTQQEPCWLRGIDQQNRPSIAHGQIDLYGSSWVFIENLEFNGGHQRAIGVLRDPDNGNDSHHIAIRNNIVRDHEYRQNTQAIYTGLGSHEIVIHDNLFHDLGAERLNNPEDGDFHGFNPRGGYNQWFLNNTCYRLSGDCVQLNASSVDSLHHIYIGKNTAWENRQGGVWAKAASDVVISQNVTHSMNGGGGGNAGHCYGGQYAKERIWFLFNECHDAVFGFRQSSTNSDIPASEVYYIGNVVYNMRPKPNDTNYNPSDAWHSGTAFALWHGVLDRFIVDNTIYGVRDGLNGIFNGGITLSGNIVSNIGEQEGNSFFTVLHPARNNNVTMDHNLFFDENRESYYSWQEKNGIVANSMSSIADIREQTTYCQESCDFADPLFLNPSLDPETRDFHLQAGSPAIGANIKHPVYDRFEELYGLNIYKDFNGNDRHPTSPSLGAFEYVDETDPFDPAKLQVKIKYPTKNPVYTPNGDVTAIQFGGHASYEDETITVDWVLAQCETDCVEELADGTGDSHISGSTQTSRVVDYPQNNFHVNSQALFPGRNILIINAVHPNGEKKITSLIIESEVAPVDEQAPVIEVLSPVATAGVITRSNRNPFTLSGGVSDNVGLNSLTWLCLSGCTGSGAVNISVGRTELPWQFSVDDLQYGLNRIVLMADDAVGNTTSLTVSIQVNDTEAPSLEILQAAVSLTGSVSDNRTVESVAWSCVSGCTGNGMADVIGNTWRIDDVILSAGNNRVRVEALDAAGNRSTQDFVVTQ